MSQFNDIKEAKSYREIAIEKVPKFIKDWRGTLLFAVLNVCFGLAEMYYIEIPNFEYSRWIIPGELHLGLGICGLLIFPIEYYADAKRTATSNADSADRAQMRMGPPAIPLIAIILLVVAISLYRIGGLPLTIGVVGVAACINIYLSSPKAREVVGI